MTAVLFDPIRKWIQARMDQFFYRTRYDYRRTLIEFGRELSSETDLDHMLSSVVDRLAALCWWIGWRSFFAGERDQRFVLDKSFGMASTGGLELSLARHGPKPADTCSSTTLIRSRGKHRAQQELSPSWS